MKNLLLAFCFLCLVREALAICRADGCDPHTFYELLQLEDELMHGAS